MSTFRQKVQATTNWVKPDPEDLVEAPRAKRRAGKRRSAPVTAHRLFPAFAALWFAALFGLGSLAIPGAMLGAVVLKTGLPAVLPAAAPPLGTTAHVLVAFALAMFGAALGLALARRLRPQRPAEASRAEVVVPAPPPAAAPEAEETYKVRARDAHPDAPPRRPLVLTEALVDPIDEPVAEAPETGEPLLRRKRSFFSSEPVAEPAAPWIPEFTPGGHGTVRPLDLSTLDLEDGIEQPFFARPEPVVTEVVETPEPQVEAQAELEAQPEPVAEPAFEPVADPAAPVLIAATPQLPAGFTTTLADTADGKWSPVAGAPLENLGLVQLIERLALAIAEQKAANEAVIAADAAAQTASAPQPVAEEIPAAPAFEPGPFSQPAVISPAAEAADAPAAGSAREALLRRLGAIAAGEPVEAAAIIPSAARPFTRPAPAAAPTDAVVPIRPAEAAAPAVSLPASAPMAPVEADEALRSALATLQRMTARG